MTHKCKGQVRSPKGDRLLVLLATDRGNPEIMDMIAMMRARMPCCSGMTDEEIKEEMQEMIAEVPKRCPECDGSSD